MSAPTYMLDSEVAELEFVAKGSDLLARFLAEHRNLREIAGCARAVEDLIKDGSMIDDTRKPIYDEHQRRRQLAAERQRLRKALERWAPSYTCPDCYGTRRTAEGMPCPRCIA